MDVGREFIARTVSVFLCRLASSTTVDPRIDNAEKYEEVELGYPSAADDLITDYAEGDTYTDTVYGYVPVEIVDKLIEKHGGIVDL